jgi:hypothetical protein
MSTNFGAIIDALKHVIAGQKIAQRALDKTIAIMPQTARDTINNIASKRLHRTLPEFMAAVEVKFEDMKLKVKLNEKNWLANGVESGVDAFAMVKTHLRKNFKISEEGHKYKVIPLRPYKAAPGANTEKSKAFWLQLVDALTKPKYARDTETNTELENIRINDNGSVTVNKEVSNSPLTGLFQSKQYSQMQDYLNGKKPTDSQFVLFRTISDKYPNKFVHPGIKAANIFGEAKPLMEHLKKEMFTEILRKEIENSYRKKG